jgi:hypothetical protein
MTNDERDRLLLEIHGMMSSIKSDVGRHEKTLYGNGQPGLCTQVQELKDYHRNENNFLKRYGGVFAWLVTTILAIYSVIKHH